ncbi:MAG TPA: SAM-dependent chlorinase/fluorinase [Deltaproteobacteria bacterium]|jgi:hypothetical protein|nr:SAM-dependent chlorinase/fluorinase [Deltaproteobacteria bacterium]HQJ09045.1 SAM-dependent chlorinase/fluorinase [Deltaproteobacteria bacterium]
MSRPLITLLSDFGTEDAYVAQVKARILSALPDATIVDITHEVPPYGVLSAAWLLFTSYGYFPAGSIHLCVVDPGVGTSRAAVALKKDGHTFVGPDNGVFSFLYPADEATEILWRPEGHISPTFHARDIFAPAVGEIMKGVPPKQLGQPLTNPVRFDLAKAMVVHIDRFGTVITNVDCSKLKQGCAVLVGKTRIERIAQTFSDIPPGEPALVCGSASTIEIAANRMRAADILGAEVGMELVFEP